jgi:hypothetical protein
MKIHDLKITFGDALRVKSAEFWLQLGQPLQALNELRNLPEGAYNNPWTKKVLQSASRAAAASNPVEFELNS